MEPDADTPVIIGDDTGEPGIPPEQDNAPVLPAPDEERS
jgi:hypothetical protein